MDKTIPVTIIITSAIPFVQYFAGIAGLFGNNYFHFDLEQFGLKRSENESWLGFINRLNKNAITKTKNFSSYDLSLTGARDLNGYSQASPEVYYFSFVTSTTKVDEKTGFHIPFEYTQLLNKARAKMIGSRSGYWPDGAPTDSSWYENDGVVNTVSMYGPSTGINGSDPIVEYDKNELLMPGQWYWIKINNMDHWSMIGHFISKGESTKGRLHLINHAKILKTLPLK